MMGCECGGFTARAKEVRGGAVLRYERCGTCGRCGRWVLAVHGRVVRGVPARLEFLRLSGGCAP